MWGPVPEMGPATRFGRLSSGTNCLVLFTERLAKTIGMTYALLVLGFSYFAIYPSWRQGEPATFVVTMFWMLTLAAIVTTYAVAVVLFGGEDSLDHANRGG